jgi:L-seryl-tRNA(Ser) seleniumtransferase
MVNVYEELGVEPIINAAGTLTTLGGSLLLPEVNDAMLAASRSFVDVHELHLAAGRRIAELVGVEAAHVCAGAAAGITLMAAACMTGTDPDKISRLPNTAGMKHRFVVQRAHRNPFDQALRLAGGEFVEVGPDGGELAAAVDGGVAAVYHTVAWFCVREALPLAQVAEVAHQAGVPVIVDAAAEVPPVENLARFIQEGADLVAFSGGKAMRGPQSSGFLLGNRDLIEACRLNDNPCMAIGRPMKVSKEEIAGLVKALECYVAKDHAAEMATWERWVAHVIGALAGLEHVRAVRQLPFGVGQQIPHVALTWDERALGVTYGELVQKLRDGQPRIAVQLVTPQDYAGAGLPHEVRIHPHTLGEGEEIIVAERVRAILVGL